MADKVLRFTAEDSGYGQAIDRMAAKLRSAFSGAGMGDILSEADSKFTNFSDKLKFIKSELNSLKELNEGERTEAVKGAVDENMRTGYKRPNDLVQRQTSAEYEREEKTINRLIGSLDRLGEKLEDTSAKQPGEEDGGKPPILPPPKPQDQDGGGGSGGIGGALSVALGVGIERLAESVMGYLKNKVVEGYDLAKQELVLNRQLTLPSDTINDAGGRSKAPYELGIGNKDFLQTIATTASSRRSATDIVDETLNRLRLTGAYGVSTEQFSGLDRFYRRGGQYSGGMLDASGMDATRTITEILTRADKQGILGVSKGDFTMLPEKIGQVTAMMGQQYATTERTNAGAAIGLMLAGNKIGGRFNDDRAADTFGRLNEGVSNPNSPGMRAFIFEVLRRANPNTQSPMQLEGLMQEGLSNPHNAQAIFGSIQNVRSREMRGRILQSLGLDAQSAYRLAGSENLQSFMGGLSGRGALSSGEYTTQQGQIKERGEQLTLTTEKWATWFGNGVTSFGDAVTRFVNGLHVDLPFRDPSKPLTPQPKVNTNKVIPAQSHIRE